MRIPDENFRAITGILFVIAVEAILVVAYLVYKWLS